MARDKVTGARIREFGAHVPNSGLGDFLKFARDSFGRVSGTTPVVVADIHALIGTPAIGAKNGSTVTATESGGGVVRKTVLTLAATPITMRDTEQGGGVKIYDFPEGRILILGATGDIAVTTTSTLASTLNAGVTCNWGVGTTTQASATVATTEQDIIQVTAFTASATINVAGAVSKGVGVLAAHDGTTTAKDAYLNLAVAGATDIDADATVTVTGEIEITWLSLGDF